MSEAQGGPDQRLKILVVLVWAILMVVACGAVLWHNHAQLATALGHEQTRLDHPNIDGVEVGMAADAPEVAKLVSARQPVAPLPPGKPKDVVQKFKDGTSIYYNAFGEVGGVEGTSLRNGTNLVVQTGEPLDEVQEKLGKPFKDMTVAPPRSVVYMLAPGICTQIDLNDHLVVSKLNLYQVNPTPSHPSKHPSKVVSASP